MTWHHAMERYGSDKPDLRFGLELVDLSEVFAATEFRAFQADVVKGIRVPGEGDTGRSAARRAHRPRQGARRRRARVDARAGRTARSSRRWRSSCPRPSARARRRDWRRAPATCCSLAAGAAAHVANHVLGTIRLDLGRPPVHEGGRCGCLLGRRLPALRGARRRRHADPRAPPVHRCRTPTTSSCSSTARARSCSRVRSLVVRPRAERLGARLGQRADPRLRPAAADLRAARHRRRAPRGRRFGFLLDAFRFGAPPHAGFAFGIDRLVAILAGEDNIREVIAFPKTQSGADPLTGAPTPLETGAAARARAHGREVKGGEPEAPAMSANLFAAAVEDRLQRRAPLAARLRPRHLDDVVGQEHLLGPGKPLRTLIESDRLSSVVLWGPPGTGKTTIARLVAGATEQAFEPLSAVSAGVKDVREVAERARSRLGEHGQGTILFLDEVHRFNRTQQDALLPHVEEGLIVLVERDDGEPVLLAHRPAPLTLDALPPRAPGPRRAPDAAREGDRRPARPRGRARDRHGRGARAHRRPRRRRRSARADLARGRGRARGRVRARRRWGWTTPRPPSHSAHCATATTSTTTSSPPSSRASAAPTRTRACTGWPACSRPARTPASSRAVS